MTSGLAAMITALAAVPVLAVWLTLQWRRR